MREITIHTTVRELLVAYPQLTNLLLTHGMCADCEKNPPAVPLHQFARKHCGGDIEGLLGQIRAQTYRGRINDSTQVPPHPWI
jgi:hypothetical protein